MVQKFNRGDKVVVGNVRSASSIGYIGSLRKVAMVTQRNNENLYYTESVSGTGGAWFYENELTSATKS